MKQINEEKKIPQDIIGDIAILKFDRKTGKKEKKKLAFAFLKKHRQIKTIFEKTGKIHGRLRKPELKFLAGINKKEATYRENNCIFKFDVDETYFSPRLSWNRMIVADDISKKAKPNKENKILVMFAGVAPYPIVIARKMREKNKKFIVISSEINRKACEYAGENVKLNKLQDYVLVVQGDSKKIGEKLKKMNQENSFDFIVMPRPNLKETFLKEALKSGKSGAKYYYHGFGTKESVLDEIKKDAGRKIGKITLRVAGEIGVRKYRWLAEFFKK